MIICHDVRHSLISVVLGVLIIVVRVGHLGHELAEEFGKTCTVFGFELLEALNVAFDDLGLRFEIVADLLADLKAAGKT